MTPANRNLLVRVITSVVAVPLLILVLELGGWLVSVGLLIAAGLAAYEYFAVVAKGDRPLQTAGILAALVLAALSTWGHRLNFGGGDMTKVATAHLMLVMLVLIGVAGFFVVRPGEMSTAWPRLAMVVAGAIYTGLPLSFIARLREIPVEGRLWCYLPMVLTWGNDTFAYFCGRAFGKHKLNPAVSPGKTWEGFIGALLLTVGTAFLWRATAMPSFTIWDCLGLGVGISILGPIGDLTESVWKRSMGIKDSGTMIPGHGGLLDRIDALMFTAPYLYFWAAFMTPWKPF